MSDKYSAAVDETTSECKWCRTSLSWSNLAGDGVCMRCYNILTEANITHREIFGATRQQPENAAA